MLSVAASGGLPEVEVSGFACTGEKEVEEEGE
jgi:hypothetical protein